MTGRAWGRFLEVPTANGCDPLAPERVIQLRLSFSPGERWGSCFQVVNARSRVIDLANVRYVFSKTPIPLPAIDNGGRLHHLRKLASAAARFRCVPTGIQSARSLSDAARMLHSPDFDRKQAAIVEGDLSSGRMVDGVGRGASVLREPNRIAHAFCWRWLSGGGGYLVPRLGKPLSMAGQQ